MNVRMSTIRKTTRLKQYPVVEACVVALVTAVVNFPSVFSRTGSSELIAVLFSECEPTDFLDDHSGLCEYASFSFFFLVVLLSFSPFRLLVGFLSCRVRCFLLRGEISDSLTVPWSCDFVVSVSRYTAMTTCRWRSRACSLPRY